MDIDPKTERTGTISVDAGQTVKLCEPINRVARRVMLLGIHWEFETGPRTSEYKPPLRKVPIDTPDLTGITVGRLKVIGMSVIVRKKKSGKTYSASWVCRCVCGLYCLRIAQQIHRGSYRSMCIRCSRTDILRRAQALDWNRSNLAIDEPMQRRIAVGK